jgi:predicted CoA-substrate-specific enzyme activase
VNVYLGIDVGSVTTKLAVLDEQDRFIVSRYLRTMGQPVNAVQQGLMDIGEQLPDGAEVRGVGTTGSARYLAGVVVGADVIKNEITSHALAALQYVPRVRTVIEIGGQDSKFIMLRDGAVTDFGMNTVCAAGTGSFLDHQALRLNVSIEEVGPRALLSRNPVRIGGRCTVFAESDMVHKQQMGHGLDDILRGLCEALVRNYLNNVGLGRDIVPPVVFQGGVAFNKGIVQALADALDTEIIVPSHHEAMGAIGVALLAHEEMESGAESRFKGFAISEACYSIASLECEACSSLCEIAQISLDGEILACWGGQCDLWERSSTQVGEGAVR